MTVVGSLGRAMLSRMRALPYVAALICASLGLAVRPSVWSRPLLRVLIRQVYFTAVQGLPFMSVVAFLLGALTVIQAQRLSAMFGSASLSGAVLVLVLMRELAPLIVNFITIGRSGAAIAAEMAAMRVNGDVTVLDSQGLDPMIYLVMPRVLGVGLSVFCLSVVFSLVSLTAGYVVGSLLGLTPAPDIFFDNVLHAVAETDPGVFLAKTLLPGMATAAIACGEGLGIRGQMTEIPQAVTRAVVRATFALVLIFAFTVAATYG